MNVIKTSIKCSETHIIVCLLKNYVRVTTSLFSVTTLLHSATTLLFHVAGMSIQCFDTFVLYYTIPTGTYCTEFLLFIFIGSCRQTFI